MACKYWYDGQWRTETQFKKILSEGVLTNLLANKTVSLEQLMPDAATQETLVSEGATKAPVTLRIRHKAQTKINNGREPGKPNVPLARNPKDVIEEFVAQGGKPFELKFVIKVKGDLKTGKGSKNEAIKQDLLSSPIGNKIVSQLQEGIVYMLVPSAYGMYPIRVFNNFLFNSKTFGTVKQALEDLKKATKVEDIAAHRKTIESLLYRTTVTYDAKKKTFAVKQIDGSNNITVQTFPTTALVADFLGKQLQRVAYNNINSGNYNERLADNGVITTDLFSDSASFFNSSSFVLEAFKMSEKDQEGLDTIFNFTFDEESLAAASVTTERDEAPIMSSQNKTEESPIYSASIDDLIPGLREEAGPTLTLKLDELANDASKFVTVESVIKDGKILVSKVTKKQKVVKKNEADTFESIYDITSGKAYKEAVLKFFDSKEVKTRKEELAGKPTPVAKVETAPIIEPAPTAPKSVISNVLDSMIDMAATMQAAPIDIKPEEGTEQSLESLISNQSNREIGPEQSFSFDDLFANESTEGFDGAVDRGTPDAKTKMTDVVDGTSWSQAEEIEYLQDKIGIEFEKGKKKTNTLKVFNTLEDLKRYLPKETYEMLLESRRNGKFIHGLFTTAAVFIASTAEAGTSYHEAFHVVFNLALPLEKRIALINEAYIKYRGELPVTKYTNSKGETKFKYPTYLEVEELLADKFMAYVLNKEVLPKEEAVEEGPRKRIPILPKFTSYTTEEGYVTVPSVAKELKEIEKFFKGLSRMLTVFYKKNRVVSIDNLFENIDLGVYKDKINFSKTAVPNLARLHATDVQYKYVNPIEEAHAFEYLSTLKDEILEQYRSTIDPTYELSPKDLIAKLGVHTLYSSMLSKLKAEAIYNSKKDNPEMASRLKNLFGILTNNQQNIKTSLVEGVQVIEFTKASDLLLRFNSSLRKEGLYIKYDTVRTIKEKQKSTDPEDTTGFEQFEDGEDTYEESWMRSHIETNPMESTSQRLKNFFAKIPKYKSTRKNSAIVRNSFGVTMKEDPGVVFKLLATKISNSYSVADMLSKLGKINRPYIKDILDEVTKDEKLLTDLWLSIGQKSLTTFSFVWETNNEMRVVTSNRKTLDNVIKEELIANFLVPSNPLLSNKNNVFDVETVNIAEANNFLEDLNTILPILNNGAFWKSEAEVINMFNNVAKTLQKYKIELTADDLANIWQNGGVKASWLNVVDLVTTIQNIAVELAEGNNPFTSSYPTEEEISRETKKAGRTLLEKLAKQIMPVVEKDIMLAARNIDNKTVYSLILSGFINKQMETFKSREKLTEYYDSIKNDSFVANLPLLKDLLDDTNNTQDILSTIILDGFTRQNKNESVSYTDMSDTEMEATSMAMFYNNGAKDASFFKMPIPSDAPTLPYIKSNKLEREEVINKLVDTAKAEYNRIRKVKTADDSVLDLIPNYKKRGDKFVLLSFLNGKVSTNQNFDEELVRAEIEKFFSYDVNVSPFFKNEIAKYKKEGIVTSYNEETGAINFAPEIMDKTIKDSTTFFKDYLLNSYYFNTQIGVLLSGDPAFYKSTGDLQKRFKQVISPGTYANTSNLPTYYKAIILNDEIVPTERETFEHIETIISKSNLPQAEKESLIAFWNAKTTNKDGNNTSDAATYVSPQLRKQRLEALGRWTDEHDAAYDRVIAGTETIEDLLLMDPPFKPEKPFVFTQRIVENGDGTTTVVPIQIKNAETVLTKSFAQKKDANGDFLYPKLAAIYEDMVVNETYNTAIFESAVKVGGIGNTVQGGKVRFSDYSLTDGKYSLSENAAILDLKHEDWRLQQETPSHYIDDKTNFATQLRNLIIADLDFNGDYKIGNKTYKGADLALMYQKIVVEDLKTSFEEVSEMFLDSNGKIDYTKLVEILKEEILDRDLGQDYLDAIALVPEVLVDGSQSMVTTLPLYHPMIMYKMESVLNSFFKNRVTKQKIRGGSLVNTTSFGVSDKLKMIVDPTTGAITYQALMPHTSKKYFPTDKNGEVDIEFVRTHAKELLKVIGIRIPTEDKYSMFNIEIVGFTPPSMASTIILPREVTTVAGLDFDIDKLYFMSRAFTVNKKGIPQIIKYIKSPKNKTEALESAKNIYADFKSFKKFAEKYIKDPKQKEAVLEARRAIADKQISNTATSKEIEQFKATIAAEKQDKAAAKKLYGVGSEVFKKHQDNIDNLYAVFGEEMEAFNELKAEITDNIDGVLGTIADVLLDVKFNSIEFNTKQARDNMKLDIMEGVLENSHTAPSILNVGNFDALKERAAKIRLLQEGMNPEAVAKYSGEQLIKEAEKLDDAEGFNFFFPSVQLELFKRNMMGKKLIGIFANHNTHHAKAQFTNLQLRDELVLNEQSYLMLNKQYDNSNNRISRKLATNLAAVVDNAKDPVASFINMNTFTANTIALLERLGVEDDYIYALINQPVILELTREYFNNQGSLVTEKNFSNVKTKWQTKLAAKLKEAPEELEDISLITDVLEKHLKADGSLQYYKVQLESLKLFEKLYGLGEELAVGIQAAKVDTAGVGPTSADNYVTIQKQTKILTNIAKETNSIVGLEEMFWKGSANQVMMPGFNEYGILSPINILNQIFPSIGTVDTKTFEINYSLLGDIKNQFADFKPNGLLKEREARMINTHFMSFIASGFPFFNYSQSKDIIKNLPSRVASFNKSIDASSPYKYLFNNINVIKPDGYAALTRLEFYSTGKTDLELSRLKASWERMLIDTNPEVRQLGLDLIKYTFFTNGYGYGPNTFSHLIPIKFYTDAYQLENNITDSKGNTFNQYLKKALFSDKLLAREDSYRQRFVDQFIRNNYEKEKFVQSVKVEKVFTTNEEKVDTLSEGASISALAAESKTGIILTSKGYLVVNKKKNMSTLYPNNIKAPVKFLKIYVNNKPRLFEYVPTEFEQQNPNEYNVKSPDRITYKPVSKLGLLNYILEYNYGGNIENSILVNAKNTPNPKVASQAASMDAVSNSILASFQAEEAAAYMQEEPQSLSTLLPPSSTPISTGMDFLQNAMDRSATLRADMQSEEGTTAQPDTKSDILQILNKSKYSFLASILKYNNTTLSWTKDNNVAATYYLGKNKIEISENLKNSNTLAETIAHEAIHAIIDWETTGTDKRAEMEQKIAPFINDIKNYFKNSGKGQNEYIKNILTTFNASLVKENGTFEEVITYAFTDKFFAEWLNSIPASGVKNESKTLWGKLKDLIIDLLEPVIGKTKLDELNDILDSIFVDEIKSDSQTAETSSSVTREYTPENITTLKPNEVFVFGANTAGGHGGGTAGLAQRGTTSSNYTALPIGTKGKWSEYGIVDKLMEGTEGKSFGIVTKAASISGTSLKIGAKRSVSLNRIEESINALIKTANENPNLKFLVTKFGTNMAGFSEQEMKSLLENKTLPNNIILPKEFEVRATTLQTPKTSSSWNEYKAALTALLKLDKEVAMQQDFLSQEEFLSLPEKEQKAAIWQAKNCY